MTRLGSGHRPRQAPRAMPTLAAQGREPYGPPRAPQAGGRASPTGGPSLIPTSQAGQMGSLSQRGQSAQDTQLGGATARTQTQGQPYPGHYVHKKLAGAQASHGAGPAWTGLTCAHVSCPEQEQQRVTAVMVLPCPGRRCGSEPLPCLQAGERCLGERTCRASGAGRRSVSRTTASWPRGPGAPGSRVLSFPAAQLGSAPAPPGALC